MTQHLTINEVKDKIRNLETELKQWKRTLRQEQEKAFLSVPVEKQNVPTKEQMREWLNENYNHLDDMKALYQHADRMLNNPEFQTNPRAYIKKAIRKRGCTEELHIPEDPVREGLAHFLGF